MVEPTNVIPRFFRPLETASDSGLVVTAGLFSWIIFPPVQPQIFDACGFVRNDRKGCHFGAGDFAYDLGEHKSDDDLRASMADALDDFFGNRQDCDIF